MFLKEVTFQKASATLYDPEMDLVGAIQWNSESKNIDGVLKSTVHFTDGSLAVRGRQYATHLQGPVRSDYVQLGQEKYMKLRTNCTVESSVVNDDTSLCFITGSWDKNRGTFMIRTADDTFTVGPVQCVKRDSDVVIEGTASFPLSIMRCMYEDRVALTGTCSLQATVNLGAVHNAIKGQFVLEDVWYGNRALCSLSTGSWSREGTCWEGDLHVRDAEQGEIKACLNWNEVTGKICCTLANDVTCDVPYVRHWQVAPNDFRGQLSYTHDDGVRGTYHCMAHHTKLDSKVVVEGEYLCVHDRLDTHGSINKHQYELACQLQPSLRLINFAYKNEKDASLITMQAQNEERTKFAGIIDVAFMLALLRGTMQYDMQGEGFLHVHGLLKENNVFAAKIHLADGTIRLPKTYNFLSGFDALLDIDLQNKKLTLKNMLCVLHKGSITCRHAVAYFDERGLCSFMYAPLLFEHCLLNVETDLFTILSGSLTLMKSNNERLMLKSRILLERSQFKENIFSDAFLKTLMSSTDSLFDGRGTDIACDIVLATKRPIKVKTAFLETNARVNMHIKRTVMDPEIFGSIELSSGDIYFPYKQLHIAKGSLHFFPNQLDDPIIELVAKNTIKKYNVGLYVTGSLQHHHIALESTPSLTEEQIVALLLVGSEQETLNMVVPAIIMQNVKNVVFGSGQSLLRLDHYFKSVLKPFKHIHLVPSFTDQTGRGGLRGAIEIDLNDRWRALIQKNFNLTEDTRFEVEYLVSDDMSIRGVRDEHRDVSAEVEMRWKF